MRSCTAFILALILVVVTFCFPTFADTIPVPKGHCSKIASPPQFSVPALYITCSSDSDCTLSNESCRSCGCPIAGHVRYIKEIDKIDHEIRNHNNDIMVCEGCSLGGHTALCLQGYCVTMSRE